MYESLAAAALGANDPDRVVEAVLRARERYPDLSAEARGEGAGAPPAPPAGRVPAGRWPLLPAAGAALAAAAVHYGAARLLGYAARRFFFEGRGRRLGGREA